MLHKLFPHNSEDGFTLIELLIVVIIIGILAAIALPIFLNQQKLAIDAAVQSDVHNTALEVQSWEAQNQSNTSATDSSSYLAAGGHITATQNGDYVGLTINSDKSYTVCGYNSNGAQFTSASKAWGYDSSTGKFTAAASCSGAVDIKGQPAPTPVIMVNTFEPGDPYASMWVPNVWCATVNNPSTAQNHTSGGGNSIDISYYSGCPGEADAYSTNSLAPKLDAGKTYTLTAYVYSTATGTPGAQPYGWIEAIGYVTSPPYASTQGMPLNQWNKISINFTTNGTYKLMIGGDSITTGGGSYMHSYFDDITITPAS